MLRHGLFAAMVSLTLNGWGSTALAEFKPSPELRSACLMDALRLCPTSLADMDKLEACMESHKAEASQTCRAQYEREKTAKK